MTCAITLNDLNIAKELDRDALTTVLGRGNYLQKIGAYNKWVYKYIAGYQLIGGRMHRKERWDYHQVTQYMYYRHLG